MARRVKNGSPNIPTSSPSSPAPPLPPALPPQPAQPSLPARFWPGVGCSGNMFSVPQPQGSSSFNPWAYPPGGFMNILQQPLSAPSRGENSHFVGLTQNSNSISPPPPPCAKGTPSGQRNKNASINIDDNDSEEATKTTRKRHWSHNEEVKLASAWLNASKDPIHGNDKKSDSFWGQITKEFNKDNPPDRSRDTNLLKVHWSRLSKTINEFNGYWSSVCKMNKSGYSDDQLMDEAQQMYTKKHGKPFSLVHWWRILKNEHKWCTHVAQLQKEKSKAIHIDIADDREEQRPMGRETAKEQRKGKHKAEQVIDGIVILGENINKIVEITQERKKEREKVTKEQLEISRASLEVAKEQKKAKFLEAYTALLVQDTTNMSEEAKASREKTLIMMQKTLVANFG